MGLHDDEMQVTNMFQLFSNSKKDRRKEQRERERERTYKRKSHERSAYFPHHPQSLFRIGLDIILYEMRHVFDLSLRIYKKNYSSHFLGEAQFSHPLP